METWITNIELYHEKGEIPVISTAIGKGIFQVDTLTPLLFCVTSIPLTNLLNMGNIGYQIEQNIKMIHFFYIDDLKV